MNTRIFKTMIVTAALMLIFGFTVSQARADNPYINIPEMQRLSNKARQQWWNSLTSRQQQLVRLVSVVENNYRAQTGQAYIALTSQNLRLLMQGIGAYDQEAGFVSQRMRVHAQYGKAITQVDHFLNYAQRNPYWYLPPNMRPR